MKKELFILYIMSMVMAVMAFILGYISFAALSKGVILFGIMLAILSIGMFAIDILGFLYIFEDLKVEEED